MPFWRCFFLPFGDRTTAFCMLLFYVMLLFSLYVSRALALFLYDQSAEGVLLNSKLEILSLAKANPQNWHVPRY